MHSTIDDPGNVDYMYLLKKKELMTPVSLNDYLNADNPWSKRLLGVVEFRKNRNIQQVENEYNLDKYAKLLAFDFKTIKEYKDKEFEQASCIGNTMISIGDAIFSTQV